MKKEWDWEVKIDTGRVKDGSRKIINKLENRREN